MGNIKLNPRGKRTSSQNTPESAVGEVISQRQDSLVGGWTRAADELSRKVLTSISGFLYVETVGNEEEIRVDQLDGLGSELLHLAAGRDHELNPALVSSVSNVVLNGSTHLTFAEQATIDELVEKTLFHWHVSTTQYLL